jgi:hypothetical protein
MTHAHESCTGILSGILSGRRVRLATQPVAIGHAATEPELKTPAGANIRLIRDGDVIRAIEVTCTCGERILLDCVY